MNNSDMKPGRILKLQKGRKIFKAIFTHLKNDGTVLVCTYTRAVKFQKKHIGMFKMDKAGSIYYQSGKKWVCFDFTTIKFY